MDVKVYKHPEGCLVAVARPADSCDALDAVYDADNSPFSVHFRLRGWDYNDTFKDRFEDDIRELFQDIESELVEVHEKLTELRDGLPEYLCVGPLSNLRRQVVDAEAEVDDLLHNPDHGMFRCLRTSKDFIYNWLINPDQLRESIVASTGAWVCPLYAYIHGDLQFSLRKTCTFDSGIAGVIMCVKQVPDDFNHEKEALVLLEKLSHYMNGEVTDVSIYLIRADADPLNPENWTECVDSFISVGFDDPHLRSAVVAAGGTWED